jgi:hypothetical protein
VVVVEEVEKAADLHLAEARHVRQLPSRYNVNGVLGKESQISTHVWDGSRSEVQERTITRHETHCPCYGLAINVEVRDYPGLGKVIKVTKRDVGTRHGCEWKSSCRVVALRAISR